MVQLDHCLQPLWQLHPAGIHTHTQLLIPDHLSTAAASLLTEVRPVASVEVFTHVQKSIHSNLTRATVVPQLLQFDPGYRLGSGGGGVCDIKCHPFFSSVSWKALGC